MPEVAYDEQGHVTSVPITLLRCRVGCRIYGRFWRSWRLTTKRAVGVEQRRRAEGRKATIHSKKGTLT